jgi:putative endonuclease
MVGGKSAGDSGETIAEEYLKLRGFRIIERNFRAGRLEIDIIAVDGKCLVFVEVKLRRGDSFGGAVEAVGVRKLSNIRRAAVRYIHSSAGLPWIDEYRLDLVAMDIDPARDGLRLIHLRGIA